MNVFAWVKVNPGVDTVPDWALWIIIWWAGSFVGLLAWHRKNRSHEPVGALAIMFMLMMSWSIPFLIVFHTIRKAIRKDK